MKALTVHQPWAEAIVSGVKPVENRSWPLPRDYIGKPIAIHAGKKYDEEGRDWLRMSGLWSPPWDLVLGAVVGVAIFGESYRFVQAVEPTRWHSGPWCWPIRNAVRVDPITCRGAQGLWVLTERVAGELVGVGLRLLSEIREEQESEREALVKRLLG